MDTNIYTAFKLNWPEVIHTLRRCEEIHLNITVLVELIAGFKAGSRESANREELKAFLNSPRVYLDRIDEETAAFYAHIYLLLRSKGAPIPANDLWIAASAMQHGLALYTQDSHFKAIDGLLMLQPS